jgi:hypothetical protein
MGARFRLVYENQAIVGLGIGKHSRLSARTLLDKEELSTDVL